MNKLKFELSVLFTKLKNITPISGNDIIKLEYEKMFGKEVQDERLLVRIIEEIIQDQFNYGQQEVPEDFELHDIRNR